MLSEHRHGGFPAARRRMASLNPACDPIAYLWWNSCAFSVNSGLVQLSVLCTPTQEGLTNACSDGTNQCIWVWRHWIRVYNSCSTFSTMALVTDFPKNNWMEFPNDFSYFTSFPLLILWPLNDTHSSYVLFRWHLHFIWSHSGLVVAL